MSRISARSLSITGSMPGRSTFTATSRPWFGPPRSVAKCTCAMDALATGVCSKFSNNSESGRPSDFSMILTASTGSNGGTWSWSIASSSAMSGGIRSRRVDSTCPNLTKIGPSAVSAIRRRSPRGCSSLRPMVMTFTSSLMRRLLKPDSTSSSSP
ncbi:hypothetical protein D3C86_1429830 [compost metagenome]